MYDVQLFAVVQTMCRGLGPIFRLKKLTMCRPHLISAPTQTFLLRTVSGSLPSLNNVVISRDQDRQIQRLQTLL